MVYRAWAKNQAAHLWVQMRDVIRVGDFEFPIAYPVNVQVIVVVNNNRRTDLSNLLEAPLDALVGAGILADDRWQIVASHNGSRVMRGDVECAHVTVTPKEWET